MISIGLNTRLAFVVLLSFGAKHCHFLEHEFSFSLWFFVVCIIMSRAFNRFRLWDLVVGAVLLFFYRMMSLGLHFFRLCAFIVCSVTHSFTKMRSLAFNFFRLWDLVAWICTISFQNWVCRSYWTRFFFPMYIYLFTIEDTKRMSWSFPKKEDANMSV